jgi:hypothetical protein
MSKSYSSDTFDCFSDIPGCLFGWCCGPCAINSIASDVSSNITFAFDILIDLPHTSYSLLNLCFLLFEKQKSVKFIYYTPIPISRHTYIQSNALDTHGLGGMCKCVCASNFLPCALCCCIESIACCFLTDLLKKNMAHHNIDSKYTCMVNN